MVPPSLSQRAQVRLDTEIDVPGYTIQGKLYHETLHPNGVINIATAENSLMSEELSEYMNTHCQITPSHLKYRTSITNGHVWSTVQAMPVYINDYTKPLSPVTPEHTVIGPGLGSIIAQFMWTVCDEGDGVLLTTPFYDDYRRDIVYPARAKVVLADVPPDVDALSLDCIPYLRSTILKSHQDGTRIRVLLLCNPHNPLARAYPAETITAYALLAEEVRHPTASGIPNHCHSRAHSSTCTCSSTRPSRTRSSRPRTSRTRRPSSRSCACPSAHRGTRPASTPRASTCSAGRRRRSARRASSSARWFLGENVRRTRAALERAAAWCVFHGLSFVPASAGVFFLVDLDTIMPRTGAMGAPLTTQERLDAAVAAMSRAGVFMKPATSFADPVGTRFRMTFTLPEKQMRLALGRIEKAFGLPEWPGAGTA